MEQEPTDSLEPQGSIDSLLNELTSDEESDSVRQMGNNLVRQDDLSLSDDYDDDDDDALSKAKESYFHIPYGFQNLGSYKHASKNCEICGVAYNFRFRQFIILDSRGITSWSHESVYSTVTRHLNYPAYQFNVLRMIIFSRKFNVYFALSKDYALKVFNLNLHEVISVSAEMHSVLCMVFNPGRNELITGGTGGMKFWRFGELSKGMRKSTRSSDTRPMANYGLVLRAAYPEMGGSWVKHVELDVAMQRLYCLSERNVVAYDMMGCELFQVKNAHRGPVTGCVYSISCNLLVTVGNDCDVNVWSRSGGLVHTFSSHTKVITKVMIHPEASGIVITSSMDGMVKVFSLDIMEEIYSLPVFHEGINWMECISPKVMYCCSNRQIEVFALNHVVNFWALSRCPIQSLSLVTSSEKSSRVMAVGNDSSVRLLSREGRSLCTVLPPPSISPLNKVLSVVYSREYNIMYLLVDSQQIWIYYTRTNPATRLEAWQIDHVDDIHTLHSTDHSSDHSPKSRNSTPWIGGQESHQRSPSPKAASAFTESPRTTTPLEFGNLLFADSLSPPQDHVSLTCLGLLCSPVIIDLSEGPSCPDATHFLMAGTEDGRVLFLHMFCRGMKYAQLKVHKGAVLEAKHDTEVNMLVTLCRSINGIDVQFWSLPNLVLQTMITCADDVTCHVRMDDLFLCGHESGLLVLLSLALQTADGNEMHNEINPTEGKRTQEHQGPVNSVDANRHLQIFCSSSCDGFLRLWDKNKTLLREIHLDSSLTAVCFLNNGGDVIIGLNQHIFFVSRSKVFPVKSLPESGDTKYDDNESFETESDIYEDPSVRYEGRKILQPDPTNMENYLVPFPNLQLKTSFFMEDQPPPDLKQDDQQDDLETISSMSDALSLAPTEIYFSPYSTPRTSLVEAPVLKRKTSNDIHLPGEDIWRLPDFGDSPVSSPPRTPPPEPTPPPTPPPEEPSEDEEEQEVEDEKEEEQEDQCTSCQLPPKVKGKKSVNFPSFKRDGNKLSNVRIDSKTIRNSYAGPSYAAPVQRQTHQPTEPKPFKPRKPPKYIPKKAKKQKEKPEENKEDQQDQTNDPQDPNDSTSTETQQINKDGEKTFGRTDLSQGMNSTEGSMMESDSKSVDVKDKNRIVIAENNTIWPRGLKGKHNDTMNDKKESQGGEDQSQEGAGAQENQSHPIDTSEEQNNSGQHLQGEESEEIRGGNHQRTAGTMKDDRTHEDDEEGDEWTQLHFELPDGVDPGSLRVIYIDPDTGDPVEGTLNEMPEGAKLLKIENEDEDESIYEKGSMSSRSGRTSSRAKKDKKVTFNVQQQIKRQSTIAQGPNFQGERNQRVRGSDGKMYVVPTEDPYLQGNVISRKQSGDYNVSPLTIFALARTRRENVAKQAKRDRRQQQRRFGDYSVYKIDKSNSLLPPDEEYDPVLLRVESPTNGDTFRPDSRSSVSAVDAKSTKDDVMKFCMNAFKKSHRQIHFPAKPVRPGSTKRTARATGYQGQEKSGQDGVDLQEGSPFVVDTTMSKQRPTTSTTISTETNEEFVMFPYESVTSVNSPRRQPVAVMSTPTSHSSFARAKTAPARPRYSREIDIDNNPYQSIYDHLDLNQPGDNYDKEAIDPYIRCHSVGARPFSTLDFPSLEVNDYANDWQDIVLTRARLLKQQRQERHKSAKERRETQQNQLKERWKKGVHYDCATDQTQTKPEPLIEFMPPSDTPSFPTPTKATDDAVKQLKEKELTSERPYRLRLHPRQNSDNITVEAKGIIHLRSSGDPKAADIAKVFARPNTTASIPSKCRRFILVTEKTGKTKRQPKPTPLEKTLLMSRFPNDRFRQEKHFDKSRPRSSVH